MKLIHNWRRCLLHAWSSRLIALGLALEGLLQLWAMVPPETRSLLPQPYAQILPFLCFAAAWGLRFVKQEKLDAPTPTN